MPASMNVPASNKPASMNLSPLRRQVSAEEWQTRVDLAACYRLIALHGSKSGLGGALAWPALLRKLDRLNPGYDA